MSSHRGAVKIIEQLLEAAMMTLVSIWAQPSHNPLAVTIRLDHYYIVAADEDIVTCGTSSLQHVSFSMMCDLCD